MVTSVIGAGVVVVEVATVVGAEVVELYLRKYRGFGVIGRMRSPKAPLMVTGYWDMKYQATKATKMYRWFMVLIDIWTKNEAGTCVDD